MGACINTGFADMEFSLIKAELGGVGAGSKVRCLQCGHEVEVTTAMPQSAPPLPPPRHTSAVWGCLAGFGCAALAVLALLLLVLVLGLLNAPHIRWG